ncbi:MAG: Gfo/Idh/MocA family oxidoreductase [Longimicrobiales bacterium]
MTETIPQTGRIRIGIAAETGSPPHDVLERAIAGSATGGARIGAFDDLLHHDLDGIVLATPGFRADQAKQALERGIAVYCPRPLGRDAVETRAVIDAARHADLLLGVDMALRQTEAMRVLRSTVQAGELGDIYAVELVHHNSLGPPQSSRSEPIGCMLDSGIVMIDLALWTLGFPRVTDITSSLYRRGERISPDNRGVAEDYAAAFFSLDTGATVQLSCSWHLPAGQNARIEASFYGTEGGGALHNVTGSATDFTAELFRGSSRHSLSKPRDSWAGRGVVAWADALARGARYDPWVEGVIDVASTVDRILGKL